MPSRRECECQEPHPVQMAVQAVVQDGVEVLQAAPVEGIDEVPLSPGLGKLGIHLIAVHDLKEVVRHRNHSPRHPCEFLDLLVLKHRKEHECWLMGLHYSLASLCHVALQILITLSALEFNTVTTQKEKQTVKILTVSCHQS